MNDNQSQQSTVEGGLTSGTPIDPNQDGVNQIGPEHFGVNVASEEPAKVPEPGQPIGEESPKQWSWNENVPGEGEAPEWFNKDKYKSVAEQAKAQRELEKRFGAFKGAPDQYVIDVSEELTKSGIDVNLEDPVFKEFESLARENNMSNDMFNSCIDKFLHSFAGNEEAIQAEKKEEMGKLGDNSDMRITQLENWGKNNLSENEYSTLKDFCSSAERVEFMEKLITQTSPSSVPGGMEANKKHSKDELISMQDPFNTQYGIDDAYTKKVDKLWQEHYEGQSGA